MRGSRLTSRFGGHTCGRTGAAGRAVAVLAALGAAVCGIAALRRCLAYIEVRGDSMVPALCDGDRVVGARLPARWLPRGAFVVGRMPREAAPQVADPSKEHWRDHYVLDRQFVKILAGKPGDVVDSGEGTRRALGPDEYWVSPMAECGAGSEQWGPVPGALLWGLLPLRGRVAVRAGAPEHDPTRVTLPDGSRLPPGWRPAEPIPGTGLYRPADAPGQGA